MPRVPDVLTRRRGDRAADAMLRAAGALAAVATVGTLISPVVATFVPFMMFTIWTNGPHSPVLPASHEPVLMLYGRLYQPLLVGALGTAGIVFAEWINYRLYREAGNLRAFEGVRDSRAVERLARLFRRSPFLAIVVAAVTPIPYWIARILSVRSRYPVRRHLAATALGRLPRLTFFAALGGPLGIPVKWLAVATVVSIAIGAGLALTGALHRARVVTRAIGRTPMHPATPIPAALVALGLVFAPGRSAAEAQSDVVTISVPLAPAETLAVTVAGAGPPGIGGSSRPRHADYSLTAQAARLAAALDSLGIGDAVLVAHSLAVPVHLLVGGAAHEGGVDSDELRVLRNALPRFTVETVAGAGHFIFEEQPDVVAAAIRHVAAAAVVTA